VTPSSEKLLEALAPQRTAGSINHHCYTFHYTQSYDIGSAEGSFLLTQTTKYFNHHSSTHRPLTIDRAGSYKGLKLHFLVLCNTLTQTQASCPAQHTHYLRDATRMPTPNSQSSGQQSAAHGATSAQVTNGASGQARGSNTTNDTSGAARVNDLDLGDGHLHVDSTVFSRYPSQDRKPTQFEHLSHPRNNASSHHPAHPTSHPPETHIPTPIPLPKPTNQTQASARPQLHFHAHLSNFSSPPSSHPSLPQIPRAHYHRSREPTTTDPASPLPQIPRAHYHHRHRTCFCVLPHIDTVPAMHRTHLATCYLTCLASGHRMLYGLELRGSRRWDLVCRGQ
jgi:hypothetical protein